MTSATTGQDLKEIVDRHVPGAVIELGSDWLLISPDRLLEVCSVLRDTADCEYELLNSLTSVDYIEYFEIVYHLTSISRNASAILKTRLYGRDCPSTASVISIWEGANFQEREIFDLMGISFSGHPNLKRLLTWEGFQGHPLRRDYLEPPLPYTWPQGG